MRRSQHISSEAYMLSYPPADLAALEWLVGHNIMVHRMFERAYRLVGKESDKGGPTAKVAESGI